MGGLKFNNANIKTTNRVMDLGLRKLGFVNRKSLAEKLNNMPIPKTELNNILLGNRILRHQVEEEITPLDISRVITPARLAELDSTLREKARIELGVESLISEISSAGTVKKAIHDVTDKVSDIYDSLNLAILTGGSSILPSERGGSIFASETGSGRLGLISSIAFAGASIGTIASLRYGLPKPFFAFSAAALLGAGGLAIASSKARFKAKKIAAALFVAGSAITARLFMSHENIGGIFALLGFYGTIFGLLGIKAFYKSIKEDFRQKALYKISHKKDIQRKNSILTDILKNVYSHKWNSKTETEIINSINEVISNKNIPSEHRKIIGDLKREILNELSSGKTITEIITKLRYELLRGIEVDREFHRPNYKLISLYTVTRLLNYILLFPMTALFLSKGYDYFIPMLCMFLWTGQMIYGPGGGFIYSRLLAANEEAERHHFPRLQVDHDRKTVVVSLRALAYGLFREGYVPVAIVRDIVNGMLMARKLNYKSVIIPTNRQLFWAEDEGVMVNARDYTARIILAMEALFSEIGEINRLTHEEKVNLARIFLRQNIWYPRDEYYHAINKVYGVNPVSDGKVNRLMYKMGDKEGEVLCAKAVIAILKGEVKKKHPERKILDKVADELKHYLLFENRLDLTNIFDDEYLYSVCKELANRLISNSQRQRTATETVYNLIRDNREKVLITILEKMALKEGFDKARAFFVASEIIEKIKQENSINSLAAEIEKIMTGVPDVNIDEVTSDLAETFGISLSAASKLIDIMKEENLLQGTAYLAEKPVIPNDLYYKIRTFATIQIPFQRKGSAAEEGNLKMFWEYYKTIRNTENEVNLTHGQRELVDMVYDAVIFNNLDRWLEEKIPNKKEREIIIKECKKTGDRALYKKVVDTYLSGHPDLDKEADKWIAGLRYQDVKNRPLDKIYDANAHMGTLIAEHIQGLFLFKRIVHHLSEKRWDRRLKKELAHFSYKLGKEIAKAIAPIQIFGRDYEYFAKELGIQNLPREIYERQVFKTWQEGRLSFQTEPPKEIVDKTVEEAIKAKYSKLYKDKGRLEYIKGEIWNIVIEQLEKNKYIVDSVTLGLCNLITHEILGVSDVAEKIKDEPLKRFMEGKISEIKNTAKAEEEALKEIKKHIKENSGKSASKAENVYKDFIGAYNELIRRGLASVSRITKDYFLTYKELAHQAPYTIFGKRDLLLGDHQRWYREKLWRVENHLGYAKNKKGKIMEVNGVKVKYKDFKYLWSEELREALQRYTLIMAEKAKIQYELEPELYAVQNPHFSDGRSITETMSMTLADFIVSNYKEYKDADTLSDFLKYKAQNIAFNNNRGELSVPDYFKLLMNEAESEIDKGQMGYTEWEEIK